MNFFNLLKTCTFSPDYDYFCHRLEGEGNGPCLENGDGYDYVYEMPFCASGNGGGNGLGRGGENGVGLGYDFPTTGSRRL